MKAIQDAKTYHSTKPKHLRTFNCEGCQEEVNETDLVIPVGPRKGEMIIAKYGCKCADIELTKKSIKLRSRLKNNKMKKHLIIIHLLTNHYKAQRLKTMNLLVQIYQKPNNQ